MLLVVAIIGILTAVAIPALEPSLHDRLQAAARVLVTDLNACRELSIGRGSPHQIAFDLGANRYTLTHSGTNPALNTLPSTSFRSPHDTATAWVTDLDELPGFSPGAVRILTVRREGTSPSAVSSVEFDVYGQTTIGDETVVWLQAGAGSGRRYVSVRVNPTTGLATVGSFTAAAPTY